MRRGTEARVPRKRGGRCGSDSGARWTSLGGRVGGEGSGRVGCGEGVGGGGRERCVGAEGRGDEREEDGREGGGGWERGLWGRKGVREKGMERRVEWEMIVVDDAYIGNMAGPRGSCISGTRTSSSSSAGGASCTSSSTW